MQLDSSAVGSHQLFHGSHPHFFLVSAQISITTEVFPAPSYIKAILPPLSKFSCHAYYASFPSEVHLNYPLFSFF